MHYAIFIYIKAFENTASVYTIFFFLKNEANLDVYPGQNLPAKKWKKNKAYLQLARASIHTALRSCRIEIVWSLLTLV